MKYIPNAIKFGTQSMSRLLIINMVFEIADLDSERCTSLSKRSGMFRQNLLKVSVKKLNL